MDAEKFDNLARDAASGLSFGQFGIMISEIFRDFWDLFRDRRCFFPCGDSCCSFNDVCIERELFDGSILQECCGWAQTCSGWDYENEVDTFFCCPDGQVCLPGSDLGRSTCCPFGYRRCQSDIGMQCCEPDERCSRDGCCSKEQFCGGKCCNECEVCVDGECVEKECAPCFECENNHCVPIICGQCQTCDAVIGDCIDLCPDDGICCPIGGGDFGCCPSDHKCCGSTSPVPCILQKFECP